MGVNFDLTLKGHQTQRSCRCAKDRIFKLEESTYSRCSRVLDIYYCLDPSWYSFYFIETDWRPVLILASSLLIKFRKAELCEIYDVTDVSGSSLSIKRFRLVHVPHASNDSTCLIRCSCFKKSYCGWTFVIRMTRNWIKPEALVILRV